MPGSAELKVSLSPSAPAVAPPWHTALLVALIVGVAALGTLLTRQGIAVQLSRVPPPRSAVYIQMIVVAWLMFFYVTLVGRRDSVLRGLLGKSWHSVNRAGGDLALAAAGFLVIRAGEWLWSTLIATGASAQVVALLPRTPLEFAGWGIVSLSVGLCEEVVYRGYLQTQLAAFSKRASIGLVLQAVLFGLAHSDQGLGAMVRIAGYGLILGVLARARGSLIPGIICHVSIDLASGLPTLDIAA